jgi:hypothetical protein
MLDFRSRVPRGQPLFSMGVMRQPGWIRWGVHIAFWLLYFFVRSAAAAAGPPGSMIELPLTTKRARLVATDAHDTGLLGMAAAGPGAGG